MAEGKLASWSGNVHVFRWCERSYLFHSSTLEVAELSVEFGPETTVQWKGEHPFVWCPRSQKMTWCHEFFSRFLMEADEQFALRVRDPTGSWRNEDMPKVLRDFRFGNLFLACKGSETIEVSVMAQNLPAGGNYLWWSLPDIYAACGGGSSYARTRQKRWFANRCDRTACS